MYEVQPARVNAGHWRAAIALVVALALGAVGIAFVTKPPAITAQKALSIAPAALLARALPSELECHDLPLDACRTAARAAIGLFAGDPGQVRGAAAWRSLLCSNTLECPPRVLTADATPVGSVIVTFAAGPQAWVNVVTRVEPTAPPGTDPAPFAWVVRWH